MAGLFGRNRPPIQPLGDESSFYTGSLSRIPALLIGMLTLALPAFFKIQKQIQNSKSSQKIDWEDEKSRTITIVAEKDKISDN